MRGATKDRVVLHLYIQNFYSHAPCGARQAAATAAPSEQDFYSHAPCGARRKRQTGRSRCQDFYSHAPCGARHLDGYYRNCPFPISTHTPHAGRDTKKAKKAQSYKNFYSHAPCGARLMRWECFDCSKSFLLTRPMRGATASKIQEELCFLISTHTPHAGRDQDLGS